MVRTPTAGDAAALLKTAYPSWSLVKSKSCVPQCRLCSAGQRHPVKMTPMQKLSQILDAVGEQIHEKLDPAMCKLIYNKKPLDLSLPVRFANVPSGSTLELHSGGSVLVPSLCAHEASQACFWNSITCCRSRLVLCLESHTCHCCLGVERKLGIQDRQPALHQDSSSAAGEAPTSSSAPVMKQAEPPSASAAEQPDTQKHGLPTAAAPSGHPGPLQQSSDGASSLQQSANPSSEGVDPIGLGRPILLFRREVAAELADSAPGAAGITESDESYYEFTPEDYHRVMAGQQAAKARAESGLRTEKLRAQEMQRRAAALGPVPIHVHFQDGLVLQVTIWASLPKQTFMGLSCLL